MYLRETSQGEESAGTEVLAAIANSFIYPQRQKMTDSLESSPS